ncbi:unnamed protein product [Sphagnum jensenii]
MLFTHYEIKAESGPPEKISRAAVATLSKDRTGVFQKVSAVQVVAAALADIFLTIVSDVVGSSSWVVTFDHC